MLPHAANVVTQAGQLAELALASSAEISGTVRIGIQPSLARGLIARLMRMTNDSHPGIRLCVLEGSSGELREWWQTGHVDLAVLFRYDVHLDADEQRLAVVNAHLVGASGERLNPRRGVPFRMLDNLPLVLGSSPNNMRTLLEQLARKEGLRLNIVFESNSVHAMLEAVSQGYGYAVLAGDVAIAGMVQGRLLRSAPIVSPQIDCTLSLGISSQRPSTPATREVARIVRRLVESLDAELRSPYP